MREFVSTGVSPQRRRINSVVFRQGQIPLDGAQRNSVCPTFSKCFDGLNSGTRFQSNFDFCEDVARQGRRKERPHALRRVFQGCFFGIGKPLGREGEMRGIGRSEPGELSAQTFVCRHRETMGTGDIKLVSSRGRSGEVRGRGGNGRNTITADRTETDHHHQKKSGNPVKGSRFQKVHPGRLDHFDSAVTVNGRGCSSPGRKLSSEDPSYSLRRRIASAR